MTPDRFPSGVRQYDVIHVIQGADNVYHHFFAMSPPLSYQSPLMHLVCGTHNWARKHKGRGERAKEQSGEESRDDKSNIMIRRHQSHVILWVSITLMSYHIAVYGNNITSGWVLPLDQSGNIQVSCLLFSSSLAPIDVCAAFPRLQ